MARMTQITKKEKKSRESRESRERKDGGEESYKTYVDGLQSPKKKEVKPRRETVEEKMEAADHSSLTILNDSRREFYMPRKRTNLKKVESMPNIDAIMSRDMVRPGRVMRSSSPTSPKARETPTIDVTSPKTSPSPTTLDKAPWLSLDMVASDGE